MPGAMEFGLLGPLVVRSGEAEVVVRRGHQRALLAILLLEANRLVPVEAITEALWGPAPPQSAPVAIRSYIRWLRLALGQAGRERISTQPRGYLIRVADGELDLARFEHLLASAQAAARGGCWQEAAGQAREALSCWRGEPLADIESDTLALREVPRLAELRLQAMETRIDADLRLGGHAEVAAELQYLCAAHPLREHLHALLMLALYQCGRQAEALAAYQHLRAMLVEELGADPGAELQTLHQQILGADPALAARQPTGGAMPAAATGVMPRQLPPQSTFAARADELAALTRLLDEVGAHSPGMVVISAIGGTAGVGKTALAVHWAHQVATRFGDGQLYVNLRGFDPTDAPVAPGEAVRGFLDALGVTPERIPASLDGQAGLFRSLLAGKKMLIVLDNARDEQQVRPLLPAGPGCLVLVTSRRQLAGLAAVDGACLLTLDLPSHAEARQMLTLRLGAERAAAEPDAVDQIASACARLPLALAVAAARASTRPRFSLAALAAELSDSASRLDALDAGDPAASLRTVFSWSYQQLRPDTARMFHLLGLHPGADITVPAAASLTATALPAAGQALRELTLANLLTEHSSGRYAFHDLLRAYASDRAHQQERAADRASAIDRVLTWYLHTAAEATQAIEPHARAVSLDELPAYCEPLSFDREDDALHWLEAERVNLVAAAACARHRGAHEIAWKIPITMFALFERRGFRASWVECLETGLASAQHLQDKAAQAWLLNHLAVAHQQSGDSPKATDCFQQAFAIRREMGDRLGEASVLCNLGRTYSEAGQLSEAMECLQKALAAFEDIGQIVWQGKCLSHISATYWRLGMFDKALTSAQLALDIVREVGDEREEGAALLQLAQASLGLEQTDAAVRYSSRAAELSRSHGDRGEEASALATLGTALDREGRSAEARRNLREAYMIFADLADARADEILGLLA